MDGSFVFNPFVWFMMQRCCDPIAWLHCFHYQFKCYDILVHYRFKYRAYGVVVVVVVVVCTLIHKYATFATHNLVVRTSFSSQFQCIRVHQILGVYTRLLNRLNRRFALLLHFGYFGNVHHLIRCVARVNGRFVRRCIHSSGNRIIGLCCASQ